MDFKKFVNKCFPDTIAAKITSKQKHPVITYTVWTVALIVIVAFVSVVNGSGRYSHPMQKHSLIRSAKVVQKPKQAEMMSNYAQSVNHAVKPQYYKTSYNAKSNILGMSLGKSGQAYIDKANDGSQVNQERVTSMVLGQIEQSKEIAQSMQNKKAGLVVTSANGTLLDFIQNGQVKYSVMPTLSTVK